jgi:hypothetical protein
MRIPDSIRDPERWLWGMVVLAVVMMASTDPWFNWAYFLLALAGIGISFGIGYILGKESGWSRGYSQGYRVCLNERRKR